MFLNTLQDVVWPHTLTDLMLRHYTEQESHRQDNYHSEHLEICASLSIFLRLVHNFTFDPNCNPLGFPTIGQLCLRFCVRGFFCLCRLKVKSYMMRLFFVYAGWLKCFHFFMRKCKLTQQGVVCCAVMMPGLLCRHSSGWRRPPSLYPSPSSCSGSIVS